MNQQNKVGKFDTKFDSKKIGHLENSANFQMKILKEINLITKSHFFWFSSYGFSFFLLFVSNYLLK